MNVIVRSPINVLDNKGGINMEGMLSPADVAVLSGNTGNGNNGYGFGDNGAW